MNTFSGKRYSGEDYGISASFEHDTLLIDGKIKEVFPLSSLDFTLGGSNDSLIFFKYIGEKTTLGYLRRSQKLIRELKQRVPGNSLEKQVLKARLGSLLSVGLIIGFFVFLPLGLYLSKDFLVEKVVDQVPVEYERKLGESVLPMLLPEADRITYEPLKESLEKLISPLTSQLDNSENGIKFYISNSTEINAFALPGGIMVFNVGLLEKADNGLEIMGVTAHELAHIKYRHSLKSVVSSLGVFTIISLILGDLSAILVIGDELVSLLQLGYSRSLELEADRVGFDLMVQAGYNPIGLVQFFQKIIDSQGDSQLSEYEDKLSLLSTHPATDKRIQFIKERLTALSNEEKSRLKSKSIRYNQLKKILRSNKWK